MALGRTLIYALRDPRDGSIRYVGRTRAPYDRMISHLKADGRSPKDRWVRELARLDLQPRMIVLDAVGGSGAMAEREWILKLEKDHPLLNVHLPGGRPRVSEPVVAGLHEDATVHSDRETLKMIYPNGELAILQKVYAESASQKVRREPAIVISDAKGTAWEHFWD